MTDLVTLQAPDGRRHRTDSQAEINLLISTYGYTRVSDRQSGASRRNKQTQTQTPKPEPAAESQTPPAEPGNN